MSFRLAKCIDITPNGVLRPGSAQDYREYRKQAWFPQFLLTTSHVRFWVDWPSLQPSEHIAFGDPANPDHHKLTGLDEQIRLANSDGLRTILMPYRVPTWVNGTKDIPANVANFEYKPADRAALTTWRNWNEHRDDAAAILALRNQIRALEYELPAEGFGPQSHWAGYVEALFDRYVANRDRYGRADYFEVVNEPNLQLWPQRSPCTASGDVYAPFGLEGSRLIAHEAVAEMMLTMDRIARRYSPRVPLLAASTSDTDVRTAARRSTIAVPSSAATMPDGLEHFVPSLLDALDRIGFRADANWIWSYHNYNDAELVGERVTALRETLRGRWHGRSLDDGPMLFATEGGIRLVRAAQREQLDVFNAAHGPRIRALQAQMLDAAFRRHRRGTGVGAGVALFTQYTLNADPGFDDGLREASGVERPAFATWCGLLELDPFEPNPSESLPGADVLPSVPVG
jgi:hypothetical protein